MKYTSVSIYLVILAVIVTACSSPEVVYQPQPALNTPQGIPVAATPLPPSAAPGVVVSTAVASSIGAIQAPPSTTPASDNNLLTPQPIPTGGITVKDNQMTFTMHTGDRFLLNLGNPIYEWTVTVDNPAVLSRVVNVLVIQGAQGLYEAHQPGQAILTATGDPACRRSKPACMIPSMLFKITIQVQS